MPHPLVLQLRFTRSEWKRALDGVSDSDARRRCGPMNCLSWNIGHLAWQEQRYWLWRAQNIVLLPDLNEQFAYGAPASTPPLATTWAAWNTVTEAADPWLDQLTTEQLQEPHTVQTRAQPATFTYGSMMLRMIYHYWYHLGENMAIRQQLGHRDMPEFVGNIDEEAPYQRH